MNGRESLCEKVCLYERERVCLSERVCLCQRE